MASSSINAVKDSLLGIIQARCSSVRLPGKVLLPFMQTNLLGFVFSRVKKAKSVEHWLVATSIDASDDPLVEFCDANDIPTYRGSLVNVSERFLGVLSKNRSDAFVRICCDSPFIDPRLIDSVSQLYFSHTLDMATNRCPRTFPKGQSVEIINSGAYKRAFTQFSTQDDFEHVTQFIYRNADKFTINNLRNTFDMGNESLVVDTLEDYRYMCGVADRLSSSAIDSTWQEVLDIKLSIMAGDK